MVDKTLGDFPEEANPVGSDVFYGRRAADFKTSGDNLTKALNAATLKSKYEGNANTNAFTDSEKSKLAGVADNANNYSHPNHTGDVTSVGDGPQTIAADAVDNTKLADVATATLKGRVTAATGDPEDLTAAQARSLLNVEDGANAYSHPNHTGDVTSAGDGAQTIANEAVTNAKMANMAAETIKLRQTTAGAPQDVSPENLPDEPSPVSTDVLLGQKAGGALVKVQVGNLPTGGGGEANLGANVGTGSQVYKDKSGVSLRFRTLLAASASSIALVQNLDDITFALVGDSAAPGNSKYYGTNGAGAKGYYDLPAAGVTDHGALTGLADDDHTQYYNEARGDARYAQLAHTHPADDIVSGEFPTARIANDAITNAKLANVATSTIKGRTTGGTGDPEDLTAAQARGVLNVEDGANAYSHPNHTGDVTSSGDGAQTIAANAVTEAKIANSAVTENKIANDAVTIGKVADAAIQEIRGKSELVSVSAGKTFALTDVAKVQRCTGTITLTIPTNASVAFAVGDSIPIQNEGAGTITITASGGVTLNGAAAGSETIGTQWSGAVLTKVATDTWTIIGGID